MTGTEGDWMAPWAAAIALTLAWLTWAALTYRTMRDNRHMPDNTYTAVIQSPDRKDLHQVELVAADSISAGREAALWVAENTRGWTVVTVAPMPLHDPQTHAEARQLDSFTGRELHA